MGITKATFGTMSGERYSKDLNDAYEKIVHWKRNLFMMSSRAAGKSISKK